MSLPLFVRKKVICWFIAVASPAFVFAQTGLIPQGPEYPVVGVLAGDQAWPQAAIGPNGGYVVWQDNAAHATSLRIRMERLDSSLSGMGAPIVVSSAAASKTAGEQEKPQVALLPGGAVIVWQGGKPGAQQICARFLDANGAFLTKDIRVNSSTKINTITPGVAALTDGSVVIVWASEGQDGSMLGVYAQRYSGAGGKLGTEFQVSQRTLNNQRTPVVAALANGGFVVAWVSELQPRISGGTGVADVYARLFSGAGGSLGNEFLVNSSEVNLCANPAVAGSSLGGFAVAWSQKDQLVLTAGSVIGVDVSGVATARSTNSWDVFGRLFDLNGAPAAAPFRLNTFTLGDQFAPRVASLGSSYVALWTGFGQDGSREGVFGQAFSGGSALEGAEFRVNTGTISRQIQPAVTSDGAGSYLAVWSSFLSSGSFDLLAQKYLATQ